VDVFGSSGRIHEYSVLAGAQSRVPLVDPFYFQIDKVAEGVFGFDEPGLVQTIGVRLVLLVALFVLFQGLGVVPDGDLSAGSFKSTAFPRIQTITLVRW
jgi:hypothetical protein